MGEGERRMHVGPYRLGGECAFERGGDLQQTALGEGNAEERNAKGSGGSDAVIPAEAYSAKT